MADKRDDPQDLDRPIPATPCFAYPPVAREDGVLEVPRPEVRVQTWTPGAPALRAPMLTVDAARSEAIRLVRDILFPSGEDFVGAIEALIDAKIADALAVPPVPPADVSNERRFPVLLDRRHDPTLPTSIPWSLVAAHEAQARSNHGGQSLDRLAERGGLSPMELYAVVHDRRWAPGDMALAEAWLRVVDGTE